MEMGTIKFLIFPRRRPLDGHIQSADICEKRYSMTAVHESCPGTYAQITRASVESRIPLLGDRSEVLRLSQHHVYCGCLRRWTLESQLLEEPVTSARVLATVEARVVCRNTRRPLEFSGHSSQLDQRTMPASGSYPSTYTDV